MKKSTIFLFGIFMGSLAMFIYLYGSIQSIKDFGECIESKVEWLADQIYLPIDSVTECYLLTMKP